MGDGKPLFPEGLDPAFLFAWKGTRTGEKDTYHENDYLKLVFVMSGYGKYWIDGKIYEISEGDLLILNPGTKHRAIVEEEPKRQAVEFVIGASEFRVRDHEKNYLPVPEEGCVLHTSDEFRQRLKRICTAMEAEKEVFRLGRYQMMKSYLIQIIILIIREQNKSEVQGKGYLFESANRKYVVEQIMNYFQDHYSEKISLDQIAENMYLSPFYISKIFKSETGETPIRHLIDIRLSKAKELLENGWGGSIQEVAVKVGYDDAYYFSKLFKKKFGVSPSKVKKDCG